MLCVVCLHNTQVKKKLIQSEARATQLVLLLAFSFMYQLINACCVPGNLPGNERDSCMNKALSY